MSAHGRKTKLARKDYGRRTGTCHGALLGHRHRATFSTNSDIATAVGRGDVGQRLRRSHGEQHARMGLVVLRGLGSGGEGKYPCINTQQI